MLQTKRLVVNGTLNVEVTAELLAGSVSEPKRLLRVYFVEVTAARNNDARIVGYKGQVQVIDHDIRLFLDHAATALYIAVPVVELNVELGAGDTFEIGAISGATASDMLFIAEYEVDPAIRG